YLLDLVRRELVDRSPITDDELDHVGYRIVTTIDKPLQDAAVDAVAQVPEDHAPSLRTGLVTLDPTDGAILALYGGPDFITQSYNNVTQGIAQAGSTFKPFTLVAYLENGGSLKSRYDGGSPYTSPEFPDGVRNFGNQGYGTVDVVRATA